MKMVGIEYYIERQCTNKHCTNYSKGSLLNGKIELLDVHDTLGSPERCRRCDTGIVVVKHAYFKRAKMPSYASKEFRFLVRCEKCDSTWTAVCLTPMNLKDVGTMEFLKKSNPEKLKCKRCQTSEHARLLQVTQL